MHDAVSEEWQRRIDACGPLLSDIVGVNDPMPALKELDAAGNFTLPYLSEHFGVRPEHVEALYDCAKFRYDSGEYAVAVDYLNYYRLLVQSGGAEMAAAAAAASGASAEAAGPAGAAAAAAAANARVAERSLQALWGRFGAEILVELWEGADKDLSHLLGAIRQSHHLTDLQTMQQRAWLLHWSLFVFANHPKGRDLLVEFFMTEGQDKARDKISNLHVIVLACPWLLRYLVACLLVQQKKHGQLKQLLRILTPADVAGMQDPMIDFLYKLLGSFDFEGAQQKLADCASVIATDYFLSHIMTAEEFLGAARRFVFEVYCRVHQKIDVRQLAAQLHMGAEEAEKWIVDLIRTAHIDARLDAKTSSLQMMQPDTTL
jgi:translation initiation factor 3 subunit E